ncbi:segregation/condensation protein A [Plantactinospora sonchi]|uniref:Segregation and condensation protein A n=1 Tax=Plantactinospora sonchi TaxID=1544735 RepID=A0ABU7S4Q1_9ACTN
MVPVQARTSRESGPADDGPPADDPAEGSGGPDAAGSVDGNAPAGDEADSAAGFTVRLANFTGPFDLLLQLIGKHKLDVTEVALHQVTDEFIAYIRAMGDDWDLDEASEFLVIAATLLDLKAARLLPTAQVEDEEDLALLEARDLLFARLLQYKAYKEAAAHISELEAVGSRRYPRAVALEPRYAEALPELVLGIGPERLLKLAIKAMTPKTAPVVSIDHVHMVRVSVREHAALLRDRLRRAGTATFRILCADCESTLEVVARFLALLELYREGLVGFSQVEALGELTVRWTGPADGGADLNIDEYAGAPVKEQPTAGEPDAAGETGGTVPDPAGAGASATDVQGTDAGGDGGSDTAIVEPGRVQAEGIGSGGSEAEVVGAGGSEAEVVGAGGSEVVGPGGPEADRPAAPTEDGPTGVEEMREEAR